MHCTVQNANVPLGSNVLFVCSIGRFRYKNSYTSERHHFKLRERKKKMFVMFFAKFEMVANFQCAMTTLLICYKKKEQKVWAKSTVFCLDENTNSHENALWYFVNFASQKYFNLIIVCMCVFDVPTTTALGACICRVMCVTVVVLAMTMAIAPFQMCNRKREKKKWWVNKRASTKLFLCVMYSCNRK